jgi:hypothetical protein
MAIDKQVIWVRSEPEYFCKEGWTGVSVICPSRAFFVPIESERRLYLFYLTRFLHANRYPLRWKTLWAILPSTDGAGIGHLLTGFVRRSRRECCQRQRWAISGANCNPEVNVSQRK